VPALAGSMLQRAGDKRQGSSVPALAGSMLQRAGDNRQGSSVPALAGSMLQRAGRQPGGSVRQMRTHRPPEMSPESERSCDHGISGRCGGFG